MANVAADFDAEITTDGAGLGVLGVGLAQHDAAGLDDAGALPNHWDDGSAGHVLDQPTEEWLGAQVSVVILQVILARLLELHGDELESLLLEPLDDFTDQSTLDTVGLDHDESPFVRHDDVVGEFDSEGEIKTLNLRHRSLARLFSKCPM